MKKVFQIALLFLLLGCGGALKNSWIDFRAYYNTYYNAKKSYLAGLDQVRDQPEQINVYEPIRVHQSPVSSGDQQFQEAIDKGARILRKFPESKWIDETLELIGKSYYYRQEFYAAQQKFEEQYNVAESPELRQRAVIWKGRVLLDLELYSQGIVFLEDELSTLSDNWKPELQAEAEVLLAEHYVQMQQWQQVDQLLGQGLSKLSKGTLKARTYFLHGQILEIEEQFGPASEAYGRVPDNRPGFELLYWANYKQAEVMRKKGDREEALAIYEKMSKDDKNVERLPEIYFEIARTEESMGNFGRAEQIYKEVLRSTTYQVSPETEADIYYRLGQIYTDQRDQYQLAAAYYDSSSSLRGRSERTGILQEDFNTETLADAYGQYSKLHRQVNRLDSLLWLGSLPEAQFDSVLAELRNQRMREIKQQDQEDDPNVLTNVNAAQASDEGAGTSGVYGFLNHKSSQLLAEARTQFQAVWGDRPLVDNWRRAEAVRSSGSQRRNSVSEADGASQNEENSQVKIDISAIPFTEEQREQTRHEIGELKFELGNLFLLTIEEQDSAAYYFRSVVEQHPGHKLIPKALFSLYELNRTQDDQQQAKRWADRLIQDYPNSRYTRQLLQPVDRNSPSEQQDSTKVVLATKADSILSSAASTEEIAKELRNLALANKSASAASHVHYESIKYYIKLAKERGSINIIPDSAKADSLTADSLTTKVPLPELQYSGVYWDSVRTVLNEHTDNFSDQPVVQKVRKLSEELDSRTEQEPEEALPTCEGQGIEPRIENGMSGFLENVELPENLRDANLSGSVDFALTITAEGEVEAFKLISKKTDTGIEEAFAGAIEEHLAFLPLKTDENIPSLRCQISFPVSQ